MLGRGGVVEKVGGHDEGLVAGDVDPSGDVEQHATPDDPSLGPGQHPRAVLHLLGGVPAEEPSAGVREVTEPVPLRRGLGEEVVEAVIEDVVDELEDLVTHRLAAEEGRVGDVEGQVEGDDDPAAHERRRGLGPFGGEERQRAEVGVEELPRATVGEVRVGRAAHRVARTSSTDRTRVSRSNSTSL